MQILSETPPVSMDEAQKRLESVRDLQKKVELLLCWVRDARVRSAPYALDLCTLGFPPTMRINDELMQVRIYYERGICRCEAGKWEEGREDLEIAYRCFLEHGRIAEVIQAAREISMQAERAGAPGDALLWLRIWREHAEDAGDSHSTAEALEHLGEFHARQGEQVLSLEYYLKALARREGHDDKGRTGRTLAAIGVLYECTGDHEAADKFLQRALKMFRAAEDTLGAVETIGQLAHVRFSVNDLDGAMENWQTALAIYRELRWREGVGKTLAGIGNVYEQHGDLEAALCHQLDALDVLSGTEAFQHSIAVMMNLGRLYEARRQHQDSRFMLERALFLAQKIRDLNLQYELHDALHRVHERRGDCRNALAHHKLYAAIRLKLAGEEKQKKMALNQVLFDVERAERDREKERDRARALEAEVRMKEKELTEVALNLARMAELVQKVKKEIQCLRKNSGSHIEDAVSTILNELEEGVGADATWNVVEQQFGKDQREFMLRLRELKAGLTAAEERICCFLRLDLQTKDMARLMFVQPRTIERHRYNIRKKLNPHFTGLRMRLDAFLRSLQ